MRFIKVDWQELEEAFQDRSEEHRYYLDGDTGAVHFFSSYLDSEEDQEDEMRLGAEDRYVSIPLDRRVWVCRELNTFVDSLDEARDRFREAFLRPHVKQWLMENGIEPLEEGGA